MPATPEISAELGEFLESGLAIVVATRDANLAPDGRAAWAVQVGADRRSLTLFAYEDAARDLLVNLEAHPAIAINLDRPTTHRACQVKGRYVSSRRARPAERALVERQIEGFVADLEVIGVPRALSAGWKKWPCRALAIEVTHIFEQTPGPGAGEPIK